MAVGRFEPFTCPHCGYVMDEASATDGTDVPPSTGAVSLCLACGQIATFEVFAGVVSLRLPTRAEYHRAAQDRSVAQARAAWRRARAQVTYTGGTWPTGPGRP